MVRISNGRQPYIVPSYVEGVSDSSDAMRAINNSSSCSPTGAPIKQIADVVLKYLNQHPEQRHLSASMLVITAIGEAWCKQ
jgi:hypothetical protein